MHCCVRLSVAEIQTHFPQLKRSMQNPSTKHLAPFPSSTGENLQWGNIQGCSLSLNVSSIIRQFNKPVLMIAPDVQTANRWEQEVNFFANGKIPLINFPDQETLPYDIFSPLP